MTETVAAGPRTPTTETVRAPQAVVDVERQFREREPGAFFVLPRVIRRVLQNELHLASPWLRPPHRKSCLVERDRLLWLVDSDELGNEPATALPERVILIARPEEDQLEEFSREDLLRYYWRRLFHARIDLELDSKTSAEQMTAADLRQRISRLGQTQFDEIRSVLRSEQILLRPDDPRHVYAEFVAVYQELRAFAPDLVPIYFPSLGDHAVVMEVISADCDAARLLEATRPDESLGAVAVTNALESSTASVLQGGQRNRPAAKSLRKYTALVRYADRLRTSGNNVRAAAVRRRAFEVAPQDRTDEARREMTLEIEYLVLRLQAALELTDEDVRPWLAMCERLLAGARRGFWSANARLLYDLQQVCLDHEQEIYRVDLIGWLMSRGQHPLKRPLPNQRLVMMSKHLRSAAQRVPAVLIDEQGRRELSDLLHAAADAAEEILRKRLGPLIAQSLTHAGLVPTSIVERVACQKVTEELLDGVVLRGFMTLGALRDAISRNQLKMPDLRSAREFFSGDPLLRANRLFAVTMDGVYQRGPFYLRWLQRLSSLPFGLRFGRVLTKYLALPFGLAFLALMAAEEVAHLLFGRLASGHATTVPAAATIAADAHAVTRHYLVYSHWNLVWLGCFIFALLHGPKFREAVVWILKKAWKLVRISLIVIPRAIAGFALVNWLLKSFPFLLFRRFLLAPLVATSAFWLLLPSVGLYERPNYWWGLAIFLSSLLVLNSRLGRDTEEVTREFFARVWYRFRVHFVVGLFTLIVDAFRWLMDGLERLLYAVDEWLRFRSGESELALGIKAILGPIWALIHGIVRFCVILLIEPQINPIKHFPVVTVSHKVVLGTLTIPLATVLESVYDRATAYTITGLILSGIPGVFGFLAWEFKENWRLYAANRAPTLRPVLVGHHGETLLRLLRPGFHSGTIPKLFSKRRRAARKARGDLRVNKQAKYVEKLNHVAEGVRHFIERELLVLVRESRTFGERRLSVSWVDLATNRVLVMISDNTHSDEPAQIEFSEQSGWLIARVAKEGWLCHVSNDDHAVFSAALAGLYKLGNVGLVREQIESQLRAASHGSSVWQADVLGSERSRDNRASRHYDISTAGLIVWPGEKYDVELHYSLEERPTTVPRPRSLARAAGLAPLPLAAVVYRETPLSWDDWKAYWEQEQSTSESSRRLVPGVRFLPREE